MTRAAKWTIAIVTTFIVVAAAAATTVCILKKQSRNAPIRRDYWRSFNIKDVSVDGIDVSHHNTVDWSKVAEHKNIRFAYIKATEGKTHIDNKFRRNVRQARSNGIACGAYLLYSKRSTPKQQYETFINTVDGSGCNLIPAIDVESEKFACNDKAIVAQRIAELSRLLENHYGCKPLIYCSDTVYRLYLRKVLPHNLLWLCNYHKKPKLKDHNGFVWQYSDRIHVSGVLGCADVNHLQGAMTLDRLRMH